MKIKLSIDEQTKILLIFDMLTGQQVGYIPSLKQALFYQFFKECEWEVEEAVIPPIGSYRNVLYSIYPKIRLVIDDERLRALFLEVEEEIEGGAYEAEVAATQVDLEADQEVWLMPSSFITQFYAARCREDALSLYHWWQINIPIKQPGLYRYIRVIEYFDQEIFNYFSR